MKKIIALLLALSLCLCFASCGKKGKGTAGAAVSVGSEFDDITKNIYNGPNGIILKEYTAYSAAEIDAVVEENIELLNAVVKNATSTKLSSAGDYTVYGTLVYLDISTTGERRLYHDRIVTKLEGDKIKLVSQTTVPKEVQEQLIEDLNKNEKSFESFKNSAIKLFSENSSFKSWYDKRKNSLKFYNSGYDFKLEVTLTVSPAEKDGRTLVWSEEFDNTKSIAESNLTYNGSSMSAPDLKQTTDDSNIEFKDGIAILTGRPYPDKSKWIYSTPSALTTYKKMHFCYGYIEMKARLPYEHGAWPSFWMLDFEDTGEWGSEIDILEIFANETSLSSAIHKWGHNSDIHTSKGVGSYKFASNEEATDWHTYGLEWTPEYLKFYVDGNCYGTVYIDEQSDYDNSIPGMGAYHNNHYILINNFIFTTGGNQNYVEANMHLTKDDTKEIVYEIDYVRLYQNTETDKIILF